MAETVIPEAVMNVLKHRDGSVPIAVVGASANPDKYGYIIVRNLTEKGYRVIPVNPRETTIAGLPVVSGVNLLPPHTGLVVFVTPLAVSRKVVEELALHYDGPVWFQDGSTDEQLIAAATSHFPHVVHNACVMVVSSRLS